MVAQNELPWKSGLSVGIPLDRYQDFAADLIMRMAVKMVMKVVMMLICARV